MENIYYNFVILGLFLLLGPFPGETVPRFRRRIGKQSNYPSRFWQSPYNDWDEGSSGSRPQHPVRRYKRRIDPSRPWLRPENNWGHGWKKSRPLTYPAKISERRLDPSRPWLRPENNWGQGWDKRPVDDWSYVGSGSTARRIDPTRPSLRPENNWGQGWDKRPVNDWSYVGSTPSGLAARRIDPSRPWLRPENNWGQGWDKRPGDDYSYVGSGSTARRIDPTRPSLRPENNWGQGWDKRPVNDWSYVGSTPSGLAARRIDPSRPWLRPEDNWGQGWDKRPVDDVGMFKPGIWDDKFGIPGSDPSGPTGRRLDPSRPWLRPGNNWGQGWDKRPVKDVGMFKPGIWDDKFGVPGSDSDSPIVSRRLDPTRPWLRPENNWGQKPLFPAVGKGFQPYLKPGNVWGTGCRRGMPCKYKLLG